MVWIYFIVIAAIIVFAGSKLAVLADKLAGLLNISSSAIGLLLVSIITSLPELSTSLGSVLTVGQPNLALGNTLGSDLFNLMIIALCDILFRKGGLLRQSHLRIKTLVHYLMMMTLLLLTLTLPDSISLGIAHFNAGSLLIMGLYLFIFFHTHRTSQAAPLEKEPDIDHSELKKVLLQFTVAALVIVGAGILLAQLGDRIAIETGLGQSFVGALFLAIATSLPELTVSIAALRIGAVDLMLGNIFGSNMFNVFIAAISDMAYTKEALHTPTNLSYSQLMTGGCALCITLMIAGAVRQKKKSKWGFGWESAVIISLYLINLGILYSGIFQG